MCVCVCVVGRPVHVLMLSIQAVRGLPRLRASGIMLLALSRSEKRRVTNNRVRRALACARLKSENSTHVVSETPAHLRVLASLRCVNVSARSSAITADSAAQRSTNDSRYVKYAAIRRNQRWTWVHFSSPNPTQPTMLTQGPNPTHPSHT